MMPLLKLGKAVLVLLQCVCDQSIVLVRKVEAWHHLQVSWFLLCLIQQELVETNCVFDAILFDPVCESVGELSWMLVISCSVLLLGECRATRVVVRVVSCSTILRVENSPEFFADCPESVLSYLRIEVDVPGYDC